MTDTTGPDWAAVRRRYEETQDRVQDICTDAGIAERDLAKVRRRDGWRRANPRPFGPLARKLTAPTAENSVPASAHDDGSPPKRDESVVMPAESVARLATRRPPSSPTARRRLLDRLVEAISLKLEQLERRMTQDLAAIAAGDATATDHERETRAIGALIDNLGKITEIETGLGQPKPKRGAAVTAAAASTDLADEAERCRRELAERLAKLVEAATKDA